MSKYISQYDEVVSSDSTDYYLLQRGTAYKKFTKANFFNQISNELGIGATTLVGLDDVDITYLSNGDVLQYNSSTEMWDCVPMSGGGASALEDLTDVDIAGVGNGDFIAYNSGTSMWELASDVARGTGIADFLVKWTGSSSVDYSLITDNGSAIGINTATYTYTMNFNGNGAKSIGMVRHTTSNTAGNTFSLYAGGATSGATDKNGGNFDIYSGISTGTGTSQFNVYTCAAGSTGTTSVTPTVKLNINGAGTAEFTTSTAASKLKIGHNMNTIAGVATTIGITMSRIDNTYSIPLGMWSGTDGFLYMAAGNYGFRFAGNPGTTYDVEIGNKLAGCFIAGGKAANGTPYLFYRSVATLVGGSGTTSAVFETDGAIVASSITGVHITNTATSTTSNIGLKLTTSGAGTNNIALSVVSGRIAMYALLTAYDFGFEGSADRTIGIDRNTTGGSPQGRNLSINAGSCTTGNNDQVGGNLILKGGDATGTGSSDIIFQVATAGSTGSTARAVAEKMRLKGSGVLNLASIPTSSAGLSSGDIWSNAGVLTIV